MLVFLERIQHRADRCPNEHIYISWLYAAIRSNSAIDSILCICLGIKIIRLLLSHNSIDKQSSENCVKQLLGLLPFFLTQLPIHTTCLTTYTLRLFSCCLLLAPLILIFILNLLFFKFFFFLQSIHFYIYTPLLLCCPEIHRLIDLIWLDLTWLSSQNHR